MPINWPQYFRAERNIRTCAERAGISPDRAATLAEYFASRPLRRKQAARVLAAIARPVACTDPQVVQALALLRQLEGDAPSLALIRVGALAPHVYGECVHGLILITRDSPLYRAAETGDLLPLAMLLHHEYHHALHGPDEQVAFAATFAFLERHHADAALIDTATRSYRAALNTQGATP